MRCMCLDFLGIFVWGMIMIFRMIRIMVTWLSISVCRHRYAIVGCGQIPLLRFILENKSGAYIFIIAEILAWYWCKCKDMVIVNVSGDFTL